MWRISVNIQDVFQDNDEFIESLTEFGISMHSIFQIACEMVNHDNLSATVARVFSGTSENSKHTQEFRDRCVGLAVLISRRIRACVGPGPHYLRFAGMESFSLQLNNDPTKKRKETMKQGKVIIDTEMLYGTYLTRIGSIQVPSYDDDELGVELVRLIQVSPPGTIPVSEIERSVSNFAMVFESQDRAHAAEVLRQFFEQGFLLLDNQIRAFGINPQGAEFGGWTFSKSLLLFY